MSEAEGCGWRRREAHLLVTLPSSVRRQELSAPINIISIISHLSFLSSLPASPPATLTHHNIRRPKRIFGRQQDPTMIPPPLKLSPTRSPQRKVPLKDVRLQGASMVLVTGVRLELASFGEDAFYCGGLFVAVDGGREAEG